ncbi:uncharacterized protein K452DRAFT_225533 [Aplosporella prunicola CBS 121167]|uniref:Blue (type 1) copper domain-containing protein n=1 Tax=Aplosporella prunicola CBS 121167 TaxID=1176127 RepID=A0A6A6BJJ0_9PEZI|nr:uncharacterized protein K452DRAFT_225533 [Aplosporella prunicola CBS 121167]KAF2143444.1 hypothetical protein K452DRAFT_225533 [Aplosporella prunicola CBS 121167]
MALPPVLPHGARPAALRRYYPQLSGRATGDKVHVVQVGSMNGSLAFYPENLQAEVGDYVQFQFNPKNHSVVQSTFSAPCVPMKNVMPNATNAFYSGFMPATAAAANSSKLTYTVKVMDKNPMWYYCSQGMHCQAGMVGAINAPTSGDKTLQAYKQLAGAAPQNMSPGDIATATDPGATPAAVGAAGASTPGASTPNAAALGTPGAGGANAPAAAGGAAGLVNPFAVGVWQTVCAVGALAVGVVVAL